MTDKQGCNFLGIFFLFFSVFIVTSCDLEDPNDSSKPVSPRDKILAYHPQNYAIAYQRYSERAKKGDPVAENNLGQMYAEGRGIQENTKSALYWYLKSAQQGFSPAEVNLAVAYLYGRGTIPNKHAACEWFKEALKQKNTDAALFYKENCRNVV